MRRLSPTELRLKVKEMTDEHNLLDRAIGYFSQYGEPESFNGIREVLLKRRNVLKEGMKEYQAQLNSLTLSNLMTNRVE